MWKLRGKVKIRITLQYIHEGNYTNKILEYNDDDDDDDDGGGSGYDDRSDDDDDDDDWNDDRW